MTQPHNTTLTLTLQLREVKEEAEGEDAVSSSSQLARWVVVVVVDVVVKDYRPAGRVGNKYFSKWNFFIV